MESSCYPYGHAGESQRTQKLKLDFMAEETINQHNAIKYFKIGCGQGGVDFL